MHYRSAMMATLSALALLASACGALTPAAPPIMVSSTPIGVYGGATATPQASAAVIPSSGGTGTPTSVPATPTPAPATASSGPAPTAQALPTAPLQYLVIEVGVSQNPKYGGILVDGKGRTLYLRISDQPRVSTCDATCMQTWPAAVPYGRKPTALAGIDPTKLKSFIRADGMAQVTFNDWPLYYYSGDTAPGQTNGQGLGGQWYVVSVNGDPVR